MVCRAIRKYGKDTKYANYQIVDEMNTLCKKIKESSSQDIINQPYDDAAYVVSVPTEFMGRDEDTPSQSFCDVTVIIYYF